MDGYATHLEALGWALGQTHGPVLELGGGWYSTPVLHGWGVAQGREIMTCESDPEFRAELGRLWRTSAHVFVPPGPDGIHPADGTRVWSVVLVDHGEGGRRAESVRHYLPRAQLLVVHDSEPERAHLYPGLAEELERHRCQRLDRVRPHTTIVYGEVP